MMAHMFTFAAIFFLIQSAGSRKYRLTTFVLLRKYTSISANLVIAPITYYFVMLPDQCWTQKWILKTHASCLNLSFTGFCTVLL